VTVKLVPKPSWRAASWQLRRHPQGGDAVAAVIAAGIIPAGLEMMDKPMTAAVEDYVHAGYDLDAAAILLCESDGTPMRWRRRSTACSTCCRAPAQPAWRSAGRGAAPEILERRKNAFRRRAASARLHVHGQHDPRKRLATSCWHPGHGAEIRL